MADLKFTVDASQAKTEIRNFEKVLESLARKSGTAVRKIDSLTNAIKRLGNSTTALERFTQQLSQVNMSGMHSFETVMERVKRNITGATREFNDFIRKFDKLSRNREKIEALASSVEKIKRNTNESAKHGLFSSLIKSVSETDIWFRKLYRTVYMVRTVLLTVFLVRQAYEFTRAITDMVVELQKAKNVMATAVGTGSIGEYFTYAAKQANYFGQSIFDATAGFAQLAAAANGTRLTMEEVKKIYEGIIVTGSALSMNQQDLESTFRVFVQVLSKGKVSAEELRQQLAERVPGAFALAAKAIGKTQQELDQMLQSGQLYSEDFIVKFAETLKNQFQKGADVARTQIPALLRQIKNAWLLNITELESKGVFEPFRQELIKIVDFIQSPKFTRAMAEWLETVEETVVQILRALQKMLPDLTNIMSTIVQGLGVIIQVGSVVAKSVMDVLRPLITGIAEWVSGIKSAIDIFKNEYVQSTENAARRTDIWAEALGRVYTNLKKIKEERVEGYVLDVFNDPLASFVAGDPFDPSEETIDRLKRIDELLGQLRNNFFKLLEAEFWNKDSSLDEFTKKTGALGEEFVKLIETLIDLETPWEDIVGIAEKFGDRAVKLTEIIRELILRGKALKNEFPDDWREAMLYTYYGTESVDKEIERRRIQLEQELNPYLKNAENVVEKSLEEIVKLFELAGYRYIDNIDQIVRTIAEKGLNALTMERDELRQVNQLIENLTKESMDPLERKLYELQTSYDTTMQFLMKRYEYFKRMEQEMSEKAPPGELTGARAAMAAYVLEQQEKTLQAINKLQEAYGNARLQIIEEVNEKERAKIEQHLEKVEDTWEKHYQKLLDVREKADADLERLSEGSIYDKDVKELYKLAKERDNLIDNAAAAYRRLKKEVEDLAEEIEKLNKEGKTAQATMMHQSLDKLNNQLRGAADILDEIKQKAQEAYQIKVFQYWESQAKDFYDTVRNDVADLFVNIFDRGREGIKSFFEDIANWFKRLLAQMIAEAAMRPIVLPIMTQVFGMFTPQMQIAATNMGVPINAVTNYQQLGGTWNFLGQSGTPMLGGGWLNTVVPWAQKSMPAYATPALMHAQAARVPGVAGSQLTWAKAIGYGIGSALAAYGGFQSIRSGGLGGWVGGGLQLAGAGMMGASALGIGAASLGPIGMAAAMLGSILSSVLGKKKKDDTDLFMIFGSPEAAKYKELRAQDRVVFDAGAVNIRKGSYMTNEQAASAERAIATYYNEWLNGLNTTLRDALTKAFETSPVEIHMNDLQKVFEAGGVEAVIKKINDALFAAYRDIFVSTAVDDINDRFESAIGVLKEGEYDKMAERIRSAESFDEWQQAYNAAVETLSRVADALKMIDDVATGTDLAHYKNGLEDIHTKYDELRESLEDLGVEIDKTNLALAEQIEVERYYRGIAMEIYSALMQLPGLTQGQQLGFMRQYIGAKYDVNPGSITKELVDEILDNLLNGTEEYYKSVIDWLDTLGISFSEFISDIANLDQAFEALEGRLHTFSSTIGSFVYSVTGSKEELLRGLAELMRLPEVTFYQVEQWYNLTKSRAGLEKLWEAFLEWQGIEPGKHTQADWDYFQEIIRTIKYVYEEYTRVVENSTYGYEDNTRAVDDSTRALTELRNAAETAINALKRIEDSYARFMHDVTFSDLAPVRSLEQYITEYNRLLTEAGNSPESYQAFLNFAEDFLRSYNIVSGSAEDYARIYAKVLEDAAETKRVAEKNVLLPVLDDVASKLGTSGPLYQVLSEILRAIEDGRNISVFLDGKWLKDIEGDNKTQSTKSTSGLYLREL